MGKKSTETEPIESEEEKRQREGTERKYTFPRKKNVDATISNRRRLAQFFAWNALSPSQKQYKVALLKWLVHQFLPNVS